MKIKIDNKTDYDSKWLRKIFNRCLRMVNRRMKNKKFYTIKGLRTEMVYKKSLTSWTGGNAFIGRNFVHLKIPRPPEKMIIKDFWGEESKKKLIEHRKEVLKELPKAIAETFIHELYHCYGYHHEDKEMFRPRKKQWIENTYKYDWTEKYPVQMKIEKPKLEKAKIDIRMKRYYRILDLLKDKQGKLKRIQNQIKKYFAKKHYYEKILITAGKIQKE